MAQPLACPLPGMSALTAELALLKDLTATAAELNVLDGVTAGTALASGGVVLDSSKNIAGLGTVGCGAITSSGAVTGTSVVSGSGTLVVTKATVDASGGGSAQTTAIATVPEHSLILDVSAKVLVGFDGDSTTDFEVGLSGNADKYIDTADFEPETHNLTLSMYGSTTSDTALPVLLDAEEAIIATWTNDASASAGSVEVIVTYITFDFGAD